VLDLALRMERVPPDMESDEIAALMRDCMPVVKIYGPRHWTTMHLLWAMTWWQQSRMKRIIAVCAQIASDEGQAGHTLK
jgi:hypothetical protein